MSLSAALVVGVAAAAAVAAVAYWRRALTRAGAAGAVIIGTVIFGFGGWSSGVVLLVFFVSSSLLSRLRSAAKAELATTFAKGSRRDLGQVLANGSVAAGLAVLSWWHDAPIVAAAFAGAMAAVTADTWATEVGVLARRPPRLVTTWRPVPRGTSGGVSLPGTTACAAGALAIGTSAAWLGALEHSGGGVLPVAWRLTVAGTFGGVIGCLVDSFLGATVQSMYLAADRSEETECRTGPNGVPNPLLRGWAWFDNDVVNLVSSAVGAAAAALLWSLLPP